MNLQPALYFTAVQETGKGKRTQEKSQKFYSVLEVEQYPRGPATKDTVFELIWHSSRYEIRKK